MNVLVACEFSGVVRRAFRERGHNAHSCDFLPAEDGEQEFHFQGDVRRMIADNEWDLMIAHPPCTYLCNSGVRWLSGPTGEHAEGRWTLMEKAAEFFRFLADAPISRIAIENPVMHGYAKKETGCGKPTFTLQPWQHGHSEVKRSCFWLKNLPPLVPTDIVSGREARVHRASPGPDRWKERSRTLPGIAKAMAEQWGES